MPADLPVQPLPDLGRGSGSAPAAPDGFAPIPGRDASAAIRGYLYQAERTVLAWLELDERTVLYCECGEDIDYLRLLPDSASVAHVVPRLLEQVKLRECRSLTLRSDEAVEAMANFLEVCEKNPGLRIRFRFFTNAAPGKEQGVVFPGGTGGIEAWERLRGSTDAQKAISLVQALRSLFASRSWPTLSAGARVNAFLKQPDDIVVNDLIMPFEWAMNSPAAQELRPTAEKRLLELGLVRSPEQAEKACERLLMHALRTIASPGLKRLERATMLELVEKGTLAPGDREFLFELRDLVHQNAEQIAALAQQISAMQSQRVDMNLLIYGVQDTVERLTSGLIPGLRKVDEAPRTRRDEPPLQPVLYAPRSALVGLVTTRLRERTWVQLRATAWMGKTQVARAVWENHEGSSRWVTLRGDPDQLAARLVDQLLLWHADVTNDVGLAERYARDQIGLQELTETVAAAVGPDALLIFDDVPDAPVSDLRDALATTGASFRRAKNHVLSTSQVRLPREVTDALGGDLVEEDLPPMDTADVRTLLTAAGAPDEAITGKLCALVEKATGGHPIFVAAAVRAMAGVDWNVEKEQINALFAGEPFRAERQQARRAVARLTADPSARDLLDRMSIVCASFGYPMVTALAGVPPEIARPHEHFEALVGRWVEALPAARYEVTPLLQGLGDEVLSSDLRRALHGAAADVYVAQGVLDATDAWQTSRHLAKAEEWLDLARFIFGMVMAVRKAEGARSLEWIPFYFLPGTEWPAEIPYVMRVVVRAVQARLLLLRHQSAAAYESDLEKLLSVSRPEDAPAVAVARYLTAMPEAVPAGEMARRVIEGARAMRQFEGHIPDASRMPPEQFVWAVGLRVGGMADLAALVPVIVALTPEERQIVFAWDSGYDGAIILVEMAFVQERTTERQKDWAEADRILADLERLGQLDNAEPLRAAALRVRALLLADVHGKPQDALAYLDQHVAKAGDETRFVLNATRASILLANKGSEEAYNAFEVALALPGAVPCPFLRNESFRRGAEAAGATGRWGRAREWCLKAIRAARASRGEEGVDPYIEIELLAELAWIQWQSGRHGQACRAVSAAVGHLMAEVSPGSDRFRETFGRLSFLLGWLASLATTGAAPPRQGGATLEQPFPGFTRIWTPDLSAVAEGQFQPEHLLPLVARFAAATEHPVLAAAAICSAIRAYHAAGDERLAGLLEWERAHLESHRGAVAAAVEAAVAGARGMALAQASGESHELDRKMAWEQLGPDTKSTLEQIAMFYPVILGTLLRLVAKGASREEANLLLDELTAAINAHSTDLYLSGHWVGLADCARLAFSGDARRDDIMMLLRQQDQWDDYLILVSVLTQCSDALPGDIVVAQAALLTTQVGSGGSSTSIRHDIARWVVRTWRYQASERGFALNVPSVLRAAVAEVGADSASEADAARLLLAAADASRSNLASDVRDGLRRLAAQREG